MSNLIFSTNARSDDTTTFEGHSSSLFVFAQDEEEEEEQQHQHQEPATSHYYPKEPLEPRTNDKINNDNDVVANPTHSSY